ncbi:exported hypothetical protein [Tenacibaculum litopenaei]|uniref:formylglycine-generating enzyme family protein n=1 Tax=Tenacibaculum litopenaei TaxID=396016 RepID=UPI003894C8A1
MYTYNPYRLLLLFAVFTTVLACNDDDEVPAKIYNISDQQAPKLQLKQQQIDQLQLNWEKPTWKYDNFHLYIESEAGNSSITLKPSTTSYTYDVVPSFDKKFKFSLRAQYDGSVSKASVANINSEFKAVNKPTVLKKAHNKYHISWTHDSQRAVSFKLYYKTTNDALIAINNLKITKDPNSQKCSTELVLDSKRYPNQLMIEAQYKNGISRPRNFQLIKALHPIRDVKLIPIDEQKLQLVWKKDKDIETGVKIVIDKKIGAATWVENYAQVTASTTAYTDPTASADNSYEYRLRAVSANNYSTYTSAKIVRMRPKQQQVYPSGALGYTPKQLVIDFNRPISLVAGNLAVGIYNKTTNQLVTELSVTAADIIADKIFLKLPVSLAYNTSYFYTLKSGAVSSDTKDPNLEIKVAFSTPKFLPVAFVNVAGGSYIFGAKTFDKYRSRHAKVSSYKMGKYEITTTQYVQFLNDKNIDEKCEINGNKLVRSINYTSNIIYKNGAYQVKRGQENAPVIHVTWYGANEFAKHYGYKLPTEIQWEYAAYGGQLHSGINYNSEAILAEYAWYQNNSGSKLHAVGTKKPNELGIYDLLGNAGEWCRDWYDKDYIKNIPETTVMVDPTGPASPVDANKNKVQRGGSYYEGTVVVALYSRWFDKADPGGTYGIWNGFRVVQ